jgi:hypothetical protein
VIRTCGVYRIRASPRGWSVWLPDASSETRPRGHRSGPRAPAFYCAGRNRPSVRNAARTGATTLVEHLTRCAMTRSGAEGSRRSSNSVSANRRADAAPVPCRGPAASITAVRRQARQRHSPSVCAQPSGSAGCSERVPNLAVTPQPPQVQLSFISQPGRLCCRRGSARWRRSSLRAARPLRPDGL